MNNLYKVVYTKNFKIITCEVIAECNRADAKERGERKGNKYGWGAKVFPAHYAMYGKIRFDHLNNCPVS